jgi:hypothetical protein
LSILLKETNRLDEAEQLMGRALEIMEKWYGFNHRKCIFYLEHLSHLLMVTRQFQKAEIMIGRTLFIFEKSYGIDHPDVAGALYNLARAVRDSGRPNEAEGHCSSSLLILLVFQHRTGQIHSNFQRTINLYTGLAHRLGWSPNIIQDRVNEINALALKMK